MSLKQKMGRGLYNLYHKLLEKLNAIKGNPIDIAKGFATGAAVSVTPFVGFHALISLAVAKMSHQNGLAAVLGTILGNPWTFPLIWYADFHLGKLILYQDTISQNINFISIFKELYHTVIMLDFSRFFSDIYPIFLPMLIGCIPLYIVVWFTFFKILEKTLIKQQNNGENGHDIRTGL